MRGDPSTISTEIVKTPMDPKWGEFVILTDQMAGYSNASYLIKAISLDGGRWGEEEGVRKREGKRIDCDTVERWKYNLACKMRRTETKSKWQTSQTSRIFQRNAVRIVDSRKLWASERRSAFAVCTRAQEKITSSNIYRDVVRREKTVTTRIRCNKYVAVIVVIIATAATS